MEKVINQPKRFVPKAEYSRQTGLSYATITHMVNTKQLQTITTESGQVRIDTQPVDAGQGAVIARLDEQERLIKKLLGHLGAI